MNNGNRQTWLEYSYCFIVTSVRGPRMESEAQTEKRLVNCSRKRNVHCRATDGSERDWHFTKRNRNELAENDKRQSERIGEAAGSVSVCWFRRFYSTLDERMFLIFRICLRSAVSVGGVLNRRRYIRHLLGCTNACRHSANGLGALNVVF